jgi:hypothetical protein
MVLKAAQAVMGKKSSPPNQRTTASQTRVRSRVLIAQTEYRGKGTACRSINQKVDESSGIVAGR